MKNKKVIIIAIAVSTILSIYLYNQIYKTGAIIGARQVSDKLIELDKRCAYLEDEIKMLNDKLKKETNQ